jgi:uncharacterized protein (DUF1330 family)
VAAYLIGTIRVSDAALWREYTRRVGATFEQHGGEVMGRGTKAIDLSGQAHGDRMVMARFADLAALQRWHDSPEYQALVPLRRKAADVVLAAYEQ